MNIKDYDISLLHPISSDILFTYCEDDVKATHEIWRKLKEETMRPRLRIKNVIFNGPATIVFWWDGTKTVVKCQPGDTYDPEKGLAMAICKKVLGYNESQSNFNNIFKKWLPKEEEKIEIESLGKVTDITVDKNGVSVTAKLNDALKIFREQYFG